jgi:phospholipase/lecithinase/hemolysin
MMKRLALAAATLLVCATTALAQTAPAPSAQPSAPNPHPYTMLYVFGDSYSDSGSGYLDTNGPTAVAVLAQRLGIPFTWYGDPNSIGKGLNFAISGAGSGAGAGRRYPTGEMLGIGMKNQVDNFVAFTRTNDIPKIDPENTMFFFAGGLNDRGAYLPGCPSPALHALPETTSPSAPPATCAVGSFTRTNIEAEIDELYDLGARRFMVALLPTKIRQFASAGTMFNPELAKIPDEERAKHPDIRIANSNWGGFLDEVMTNPAKYGITDTTSPCAGRNIHHEDTTPCAAPDAHFFYHEGHPSAAVHRAVGDMLYTEATTKAP